MVTNEIVMFNKMDAGTLKIFTTDLLSYNIFADTYMSTTNQHYLFLRVSNFSTAIRREKLASKHWCLHCILLLTIP